MLSKNVKKTAVEENDTLRENFHSMDLSLGVVDSMTFFGEMFVDSILSGGFTS